MKILALIPARGGSKRLPGKNTRVLRGKPLIEWSIQAAQGIPEIVDIVVSTDDDGIGDIARKAGASVPWLRPAALATDEASSVDVALHALDYYEGLHGPVDGLLLLQPTSPFRSRETVLRGLETFRSHAFRSVVGVSQASTHPLWCFRIDGGSMRRFVERTQADLRAQALPPAYALNGAFYLISPAELRAARSFCNEDTVPLIMDAPIEGVDIDTETDWQWAEYLLGYVTRE
ncbi:MAG: acylneuraminate cytidylyltransferase family protein [Burkholderiaceae bacterium]|nr:acylneuraminate cytidylyltransferase family protein [Burkholderiaceae bacterium]MCZ8286191.1 acylneuraminate cytidylyltransferase family protein [Bacteroidia bacterium]